MENKICFSLIILVITFSLGTLVYSDACFLDCSAIPIFSCDDEQERSYVIDALVSIHLDDEDQKTSVKLTGQVAVTALSDCVHELTVQNLVISGNDGKTRNNPPELEKPLRFKRDTMAPANEAEICKEDESETSLNIKRAIITMLPQEAFSKIAVITQLNSQIQATFDLLRKGEEEIVLSNEHKNVVLVLGNTGAGKSTFTRWIAGDKTLEAKEVIEGSGEFLIVDTRNKISDSSVNSKTIFPELVIDNNTNTAYYDYPGFSDTRSSSNDIATSYFIKKIVDYVKSIKLVFVVSYPSVRKGVDRQNFLTLLRHITDLVIDINKFQNSTVLVVTKIDNQYVKVGRTLKLLPDVSVKRSIVNYLKDAKQDLEGRVRFRNSSNENKFYDSAIQFINMLLLQDINNNYKNIEIFRRPEEAGQLNTMPLLQVENKKIREVINAGLQFIQIHNKDFGHTISENTKNEIRESVEEINKIILASVCNIAKNVHVYYQNYTKQIEEYLSSISVNSITNMESELENINKLLSNLKAGYKKNADIIRRIKNEKRLIQLTKFIHRTVTDLAIRISNDSLHSILNQEHYFLMLQNVSNRDLSTSTSSVIWRSSFQRTATFLADANNRIQSRINDIAKQIETKIKNDIAKFGEEIKQHYIVKENKVHDIKNILEELKTGFDNLTIIDEMEKNILSQQYVKLILDYVAGIQINLSNEIHVQVTKQTKYFVFFKETVNDVIKFLHNAKTWYQFLIYLFDRFSEYKVQQETRKCYVSTSIITKEVEPNEVENSGLEKFLKACLWNEFEFVYDNIRNIKLDQVKIEALHKVYSFTLRNETFWSCESNGKLVIKGNYVKLSDIFIKFNIVCREPIKYIAIFALNKIFIDVDLNKTGENVQVSIIAHTWEVLGVRHIILDGAPGKPHFLTKGHNGDPLKNGEDGQPGLPGGSGGIFFGIGMKFINLQDLTVSVNGGDGGPGQNGGNGGRGVDGTSPHAGRDLGDFLIRKGVSNKGSIDKKCSFCIWKWCPLNGYSWQFDGEPCSNGADGGRGGAGGCGGEAGVVSVLSLTGEVVLNVINKTGSRGLSGVSGFGGDPGKSTYNLIIYKFVNYWQENMLSRKCLAGNRKFDLNINLITRSSKNQYIPHFRVINEYKTFIRFNMNESIIESSLRDFYKELDHNPSVRSLYGPSAFIDEFNHLDKQYPTLRKHMTFLPFYKWLFNEINTYIQRNKSNTACSGCCEVLNYLRVATMSKIYEIDNSLDNYLIIINVKEFFVLVEKHIDLYKKALKEIKIETFEYEYQHVIITDIMEVNKQIKQNVMPEMTETYKKIYNQINLTIQDVHAQQVRKEIDEEQIIRKQNELAAQLPLQVCMKILNFVSYFLSAASPVGVLSSGLIQSGTDVVNNAFSGTKQTLFSTVQDDISNIINYYGQEQERLKNNLLLLDEESKPEEISIILSKIEPLQVILNDTYVGSNSSIYFDLKIQTKQQLKRFSKELLAQKFVLQNDLMKNVTHNTSLKIKKKLSLLKLVSRVQNEIVVAEAGYGTVTNIKESKNLIFALGDADHIQHIDDEIDQLKKYEQIIFTVLTPMMDVFSNSLQSLRQESFNKSHVVLDVSKWKMQNIITDFKTHIQCMIQVANPIIKTQFLSLVEKLQNGMLIIMKIYDRIQDYQERQQFASYIADLNSDVKLTNNDNFNHDIDNLELTIKINLVLEEYEKASDAFKQYIFPFAGLYLDQLDFSSNPQSENVTDLINNAVANIGFLSNELTKDATQIRKKDFRIFPSVRFDNTKVEVAPFMVWKYDTFKDEISQLLSGEQITMKADIRNGIQQNAVKFNEIGVNFILANKTLQAEFNDDLSNFLVQMTHLGDSYYRCDDKYYVITHNKINLKHSFAKELTGQHYYYLDKTSTLIRNNPPMCSPYTTWQIQLLKKDTNGDSFNILKKYTVKAMDLALEGWGSYVELGLDICNDNLNKYYKAVN